jgi:hypothetical protein
VSLKFCSFRSSPSTACRSPKKSHLIHFQNKSLFGLVILLLVTILTISSISFFPPIFSPSSEVDINPISTYGGESGVDSASVVIQTLDGGFALVGYTYSYGAGSRDMFLVKTDSNGNFSWMQTFGGVGRDHASAMVQTTDGGFALAGYTESFGAGAKDMWLVKTDATGQQEWSRTYGGIENDEAFSLVQTLDGGYALVGYTYSLGAGSRDIWLVKTDSAGYIRWTRTFGGNGSDYANALIQISDGSFLLAGITWLPPELFRDSIMVRVLIKTNAYGEEIWNQTYADGSSGCISTLIQTMDGGFALAGGIRFSYASESMMWLMKVNSDGRKLWSSYYRGFGYNYASASSLIQTSDKGFALAGYIQSLYPFSLNMYLVRTDKRGVELWNQFYGEDQDSYAEAIIQTTDGGFVLAGYTTFSNANFKDIWLVKTDTTGLVIWNRYYGGKEGNSLAISKLVQTSDRGFALAGFSSSRTDSGDGWLLKTDSIGNPKWNHSYGGVDDDYFSDLIQTTDGGFALTGSTRSSGAGQNDMWLVKTDIAGNLEWNHTYGGKHTEFANSLVQTNDGGFALAGSSSSYGAGSSDMWLVRTDTNGVVLWNKSFGAIAWDQAVALVQTIDGGFALAGHKTNARSVDMWLVRTDANGNALWKKCIGGSDTDIITALIQSTDGGFVLAGYTYLCGSNYSDVLLVKTDENGTVLWRQTYGGSLHDFAASVVQTTAGGFAFAGGTNAPFSGRANIFYETDVWLAITDANGTIIWDQTYGKSNFEGASDLILTTDGELVLAGTLSPNDMTGYIYSSWLLKFSSDSYSLPLITSATSTTTTVALENLPFIIAIIVLTKWRTKLRKLRWFYEK